MKKTSVKTKISIAVLLVSMFCSLLIGLFTYHVLKSNLEKYMGIRAQDIAKTVSQNINGDKIQEYDQTGVKDAYYNEIYC